MSTIRRTKTEIEEILKETVQGCDGYSTLWSSNNKESLYLSSQFTRDTMKALMDLIEIKYGMEYRTVGSGADYHRFVFKLSEKTKAKGYINDMNSCSIPFNTRKVIFPLIITFGKNFTLTGIRDSIESENPYFLKFPAYDPTYEHFIGDISG